MSKKWLKKPKIDGVEITVDPKKGIGPILAANIKRLRELKGLTQDELAERSGLDNGVISKIERGRTNPSIQTLDRIAIGLQVPAYILFTPGQEQLVDKPSIPDDLKEAANRTAEMLEEKEAEYVISRLMSKLSKPKG